MESSEPSRQFSGRRYINVESYTKDGRPKLTPVQSIEENGVVYFRTDPHTWKVRRIQRNPRVRIVPCDRNGRPRGTWVAGEGRILEGEERDRIMDAFKREYGKVGNSVVNFVGRLRGERLTTVVSITFLSPQKPESTNS